MYLSARNWLWEAGTSVAYSGTSFPSNSVLLAGNTVKMWKATTAGTLGFTLAAPQSISCVAVCYCLTGSGVSQSITVRVRSGGSGGSIVATSSLSISTGITVQLVQRAFSEFFTPVTGDYVEFVIGAGALPVVAFGFWAGASLQYHRYDIEYVYHDPTDIQTAGTGTVSGNRDRIGRESTIVLNNLVETLSIGAASSESSFSELQDALGWCGGLPTIVLRVDDIEFATTLGDLEETMVMRLANAPEIVHMTGPKHRVPLRLTDY